MVNSTLMAIAKAAVDAVTGKEHKKVEDSDDIEREREHASEDGHLATDENLPTSPISSKAIGSGLSPPTSGVQHYTPPKQFTSANPGAPASWPHTSRPVSPCQWTHSAYLTSATHVPYPIFGTLGGVYQPPIDDRYWQNPIEPIQYPLPPRSRKRVGQACKPCRKAKAKCDGVEPCSRCTEKGVQCDYLAIQPTNLAIQPTKKDRNEDILVRLKKIEEEHELLKVKFSDLENRFTAGDCLKDTWLTPSDNTGGEDNEPPCKRQKL